MSNFCDKKMNIKMKDNRWKIAFSQLMIIILVLISLTMVKGTTFATTSDMNIPFPANRFDFNAIKMDRLLNPLEKRAKHRYISAAAQEGTLVTLQWNRTYGGSAHDGARSVIQTVDGGFALVIYTEYIVQGFYTGTDTWLVKTDHQGEPQWNRTYGAADKALAVVQTVDKGFALAGFTESYKVGFKDGLLMKTDASGMIQWNRTFGSPTDDWAEAIIQTADGGFALIGVTISYGAVLDAWLVKTDTDGYTQWNLTYGGPAYDWAEAIIQTTDGGFVFAGYSEYYAASYYTNTDVWLVKTDLRGVPQWNRTYGGSGKDEVSAVIQTTDGGFALVGSTSSYGTGLDDFWLVKTDPRGIVQWNRTYGGTACDEASSIIQTADGGFALAGYTVSNEVGFKDVWLVKTDASGMIQWNCTCGGPADDWASTVIQTVDGGFVLAGYTYSYGVGYSDAWLVKLVPIPETYLTILETTPITLETNLSTTQTSLPTEFTPEFEDISVLLALTFLFGLRRKFNRG